MRVIPVEVVVEARSTPLVTADAAAALRGGASRIELCAEMRVGGTTPNADAIAACVAACPPGTVQVMARPRGGSFVHTWSELDAVANGVDRAIDLCAGGVVLGALTEASTVDRRLDGIVSRARRAGLAVTFHRAFDEIDDVAMAINELVKMGCTRVLTAGIPSRMGTAMDGIERIRATIDAAAGRLEIVVGGGVISSSIAAVISRLPGLISVHAWSSVMKGDAVDEDLVRELARAVTPA